MFPYLRNTFEGFLDYLTGGHSALPEIIETHRADPTPFYNELGLTISEFHSRFVNPWLDLNEVQQKHVAQIINIHLLREQKTTLSVVSACDYKALQWTYAQVMGLNLFEMFPHTFEEELRRNISFYDWDSIIRYFLNPRYSMPYNQCHYCGRLDHDSRGKHFGPNLKYCHLDGCPSTPNPKEHAEGCCYQKWKRIKNKIRRQLSRNKSNPQEVTAIFKAFIQEQYEKNKQITNLVRVKTIKPENARSVTDEYSFTVYSGQSSVE